MRRQQRAAVADAVVVDRRSAMGVYNVRAFGARGDGVRDDAPAIRDALAAAAETRGVVFFPEGSYLCKSQIVMPEGVSLLGASRHGSEIKQGFAGTLIVLNNDNRIESLTFDGQGATYATSRLFTIDSDLSRQRFNDCTLTNSGDYCLEFLETTSGSYFSMSHCRVGRRNGTAQGRYAIKIADEEQVEAFPRSFVDIQTDGNKFIDLGGAADVFITQGYYGGILFSQHSRGVLVSSCRLADPAGQNLDGANNNITGCDIAGPEGGPCLTVAATAVGCKVASIFNSANPVLDLSTASGVNLNQIDVPLSTWTPTVTSSGAAVDLGAGGSVTGTYSRSGGSVTVNIDLTWGGAPTVPVGFLEFSLPATIRPRTAEIATRIGSGYAQQGGTTKLLHAVAFAPPATYLRAIAEGGGFATNINPFSWDVGDVIRLSITYTL